MVPEDPSQIENNLRSFIEEEYYLNVFLFEESEQESGSSDFLQILRKMYSLLLNSNKKKFQREIESFKLPEE